MYDKIHYKLKKKKKRKKNKKKKNKKKINDILKREKLETVQKTKYCMIPIIRHSEKGKTGDDINISSSQRSRERKGRMIK